jgi:hypothetical protein
LLRRNLVKLGLVILITGVILSAVGLFGGDSLIHTDSSFVYLKQSGTYVSNSLNVTGSAAITIIGTSSGPTVYLMNLTNYYDYAAVSNASVAMVSSHSMHPTINESIAGTVEQIYDSIPHGTYYIVAFSQPDVSYSLEVNLLQAAVFGLLLVVGIIMAIAGFVLSIIALIMRPKQRGPNPDELLAQYEKK